MALILILANKGLISLFAFKGFLCVADVTHQRGRSATSEVSGGGFVSGQHPGVTIVSIKSLSIILIFRDFESIREM